LEKLNNQRNGSNLKERGISILVSLAFHIALLLVLFKIVPPVKVYVYRQVADVRIVSPEGLYLPRIAGISEESSASEAPRPQSIPSGEASSGEEQGVFQEESIEPGVVYLRNLTLGRERERGASSQATPSFDLIPNPKPEGRFTLGIGRERPEGEESESQEITPDFSALNSPALSSLRFNRIVTNKRGDSSGQLSPDSWSQQQGIDIAPWVKGVVDKIRNNWILPPIAEAISIGEVRIHAVFGREGGVLSVKIMDSSDFLAFDRTAIGAIRASAPFPKFPDNFPFEKLEAFLVFQFNE
jgi:TonB family protein